MESSVLWKKGMPDTAQAEADQAKTSPQRDTGLLFGVAGTDPLTYGVIGAVILTVTVGATWVPALRASRVDPIEALRSE